MAHPAVAQAAVVGFPHDVKGEGVCCYATLVVGTEGTDELRAELTMAVRTAIGPFAKPDVICFAPSLPMTRSGKIMRRILRKIAANDVGALEDTSMLADPSVVDALITNMAASRK